MARRKNVKRIDPRYFLHETANREEELEEAEEMLQEEPPPGLAATADMAPVAAPEESGSLVDRILNWLSAPWKSLTPEQKEHLILQLQAGDDPARAPSDLYEEAEEE